MSIIAPSGFAALIMLIAGCSSDDSSLRKGLSSRDVDIGGISFNSTRSGLRAKLNPMGCDTHGFEREICTWLPKARHGPFQGIQKIVLTFFRDSVRGIELDYAEMFDVQYRNFNKEIRRKYAARHSFQGLDTLDCEWNYESVAVKFYPNRRQHWTGTFYVYTPALEFQWRGGGAP